MINFDTPPVPEGNPEKLSSRPIELMLGNVIPEDIRVTTEGGKQILSGDDIDMGEDYWFQAHDLDDTQKLINVLQAAGVIEGYTIDEGSGFENTPGYSGDDDDDDDNAQKHVDTYHFNKPLVIEIAKLNIALALGKLKIKTWEGFSNDLKGMFELSK